MNLWMKRCNKVITGKKSKFNFYSVMVGFFSVHRFYYLYKYEKTENKQSHPNDQEWGGMLNTKKRCNVLVLNY